MLQRFKLFLAASAAVVAIGGATAAPSQAYLHVSNAAQQCSTEGYNSIDNEARLYGVRASHVDWGYVGYQRYSDSRVWVYLRTGTSPIRYSIDSWCDITGYDSGSGAVITAFNSFGVSAPLS